MTWIGLIADVPWHYVWIDGTPLNFTSWAPNRPNLDPSVNTVINNKFQLACTGIHADQWNGEEKFYQHWDNVLCDLTMRSYVCKKSARH